MFTSYRAANTKWIMKGPNAELEPDFPFDGLRVKICLAMRRNEYISIQDDDRVSVKPALDDQTMLEVHKFKLLSHLSLTPCALVVRRNFRKGLLCTKNSERTRKIYGIQKRERDSEKRLSCSSYMTSTLIKL